MQVPSLFVCCCWFLLLFFLSAQTHKCTAMMIRQKCCCGVRRESGVCCRLKLLQCPTSCCKGFILCFALLVIRGSCNRHLFITAGTGCGSFLVVPQIKQKSRRRPQGKLLTVRLLVLSCKPTLHCPMYSTGTWLPLLRKMAHDATAVAKCY